MALKLGRLTVAVLTLLTACGSDPGEPKPKIMLKHNGPPVDWKVGDRILAEGKLGRTPDAAYILQITTGTGRQMNSDCLLLLGMERLGILSQVKATIFSRTGHLLTVTGYSENRLPRYSRPDGVQHTHRTCVADLVVEDL
jgi:hypothetical protein